MWNHRVEGNKIIQYDDYEQVEMAVCNEPHKALNMLEKAWMLNDSRKYTASARLIAEVEQLPGFKWLN